MALILKSLKKWFISSGNATPIDAVEGDKVEWLRVVPFLAVHLACLGVFWVDFSWTAVGVALGLFWARAIAISAFYHRYLSHRAYKTSRPAQFIFALLGASAMQKGPLWWASYHRNHHRFADQAEDVHSPVVYGFWQSHIGWILTKKNYYYDKLKVADLAQFPEICWLDRYNTLVPLALAITLYCIGGASFLFWGFFVSTIAVFHTTASVNSLAHQFGRRDYPTKDQSRNSFWLALLTVGEGWHNNHHFYPASARIGFKWYQIDVTYYLLFCLQKLGIIWDLRGVGEMQPEFLALKLANSQEM